MGGKKACFLTSDVLLLMMHIPCQMSTGRYVKRGVNLMKIGRVLTAILCVLVIGMESACQPPRNTAATSTTQSQAGGPQPTPFLCKAGVIEQSFEHGFMFWIGRTTSEKCSVQHSFARNSGEIWVAFANQSIPKGKWMIFTDDWDSSSEPESDPSLVAPPNLIQPVRGFGKVWRIHLSDQDRKTLGWATGQELPFSTDYQYEGTAISNASGEAVARPGKHIFKGLAGDTFIFDEVSQTVEYIPVP